jgi:hypothetical protein
MIRSPEGSKKKMKEEAKAIENRKWEEAKADQVV